MKCINKTASYFRGFCFMVGIYNIGIALLAVTIIDSAKGIWEDANTEPPSIDLLMKWVLIATAVYFELKWIWKLVVMVVAALAYICKIVIRRVEYIQVDSIVWRRELVNGKWEISKVQGLFSNPGD